MAFEITGGGDGGGENGGGMRNVVRNFRRRDVNDMAFAPGEKPHSIDAERAVLSGIFIANDALNDIEPILKADDFFLPAHRIIFETMRGLGFKNIPMDLTTVAANLREGGKLDAIGGPAYLGQIVSVNSTSRHAIEYARIVADLSWRRRLLAVAEEAKTAALEAGDTRDIATKIEKSIFNATQERKSTKVATLSELLGGAIDEFEKRKDRGADFDEGVKTGIYDLDDTLTSLRPGQLIVLAARPGMGKTSLAANIMVHAAKKQKKNVLFFSLEMTREEVVERVISGESGIETGKLKKGSLTPQDFHRIYETAEDLQFAPLYIDDRSVVTPYDVLATARKINSSIRLENPERGLDLIVVDYIQIMKGGGFAESRALEVAAITGGLKAIAKDLRVPVLALSQLNRESTKRQDSRPQVSDLKDSGAIEQDADIVIFIHRDQTPNVDSRADQEAELIVAKHRGGPLNNIRVTWRGSLTTFANYSDAVAPEYLNPHPGPGMDEPSY